MFLRAHVYVPARVNAFVCVQASGTHRFNFSQLIEELIFRQFTACCVRLPRSLTDSLSHQLSGAQAARLSRSRLSVISYPHRAAWAPVPGLECLPVFAGPFLSYLLPLENPFSHFFWILGCLKSGAYDIYIKKTRVRVGSVQL